MLVKDVTEWAVLIIDDEPDNLAVLADTFELYDIEVMLAGSGQEGLNVLQEKVPTLILLDLSMPEMDGWETFFQIKANPQAQHIPVVVLSAHAMPEDKAKALTMGFDGYIRKPFDPCTLIENLKKYIK
jgi:two-component system, cell cycle response regulator DivK